MKKFLLLGIVILLSLSACVPSFLKPDQDAPAEGVDLAATADVIASTRAAQTFEALATPTMEVPSAIPPTEIPSATATEEPTATEAATTTETETATETPDGTNAAETASVTPEGTLPAETETPDGTISLTETGTPEATATSIYPSPTSPISVGEPPDSVPRYKVKVINYTKYRAYISLQGVTVGNYHPIIEYDLYPWVNVKFPIPEGQYTAVVYVGKEPLIAYFGIHQSGLTITIEKDKITIEK